MSEAKSRLNSSLNKCTTCGEDVTFAYRDCVPTHDPICGDLTCHRCAQKQATMNGLSCVHHPRGPDEQKDRDRSLASRGLYALSLFLLDHNPACMGRPNGIGAPGGIESAEKSYSGDGPEAKVEPYPNPQEDGAGEGKQQPAPAIRCDMCVETLAMCELPLEKAQPSIVYCAKCVMNLCTKHADSHRSKFGEHTVLDLKEKAALAGGRLPLFDKCSVHMGSPLIAVDMTTYTTACNLCIETYPMKAYVIVGVAGPTIRQSLDDMWLNIFEARGLRKMQSYKDTAFVKYTNTPVVTFPRIIENLESAVTELEGFCEEVKAMKTMINWRIEGWRHANASKSFAYQFQQIISQNDVSVAGVFGVAIKTLISMINTRRATLGTLKHIHNHIFEDVEIAEPEKVDVGTVLAKKRKERTLNAMMVGKDLCMLKTLSCLKETLEHDARLNLATLNGQLVKDKAEESRKAMQILNREFNKNDQCGNEGQMNQQWEADTLACARRLHDIIQPLLQLGTNGFWLVLSKNAYNIGDTVEARDDSKNTSYNRDQSYNRAGIVGINLDGTYRLKFDSGSVATAVKEDHIRKIKPYYR